MARLRTIKPEFWTSDQVVECSPNARLLFIGLWNFSDDQGVHPESIRRLKMEVFPGDDFSLKDIESWISELMTQLLIGRFDHDNQGFWFIPSWKRHQKIDKPTKKHPAPPDRIIDEPSANPPRDIAEDSTIARPRRGKERRGEETNGEDKHTLVKSTDVDRGAMTNRFELWWSNYPNKQGKQAARKLFLQLTDDEQSDLGIATLNYCDAVKSGENGGKFKHGSTFINGHWRDWVNPNVVSAANLDEKPMDWEGISAKRAQEDALIKSIKPSG